MSDSEKPKSFWRDFFWEGVFGFLFCMGAGILGASTPIMGLMSAVGMLVGSFVKKVVRGLKEKKNVSGDNNPKDEQRQLSKDELKRELWKIIVVGVLVIAAIYIIFFIASLYL